MKLADIKVGEEYFVFCASFREKAVVIKINDLGAVFVEFRDDYALINMGLVGIKPMNDL